ncbi:MAG: hypothetical protein KDD60_02150, partial [Bdellovibrionales bacterium]|nr:hypothetical protein [Bdellovibrionales bacterium]
MTSVVAILQEMLRIRSFSGEEGQLAQWIHQWCVQRGILSQVIDGNVVCHMPASKPSVGGRALIFNGHMDTVGP